MGSETLFEIEESNRQAMGAWTLFARGAPNASIIEKSGVMFAFANVPLPFFNMSFLSRPVRDAADLKTRIGAAVEYASASSFPWMFLLSHEWLPDSIRSSADAAFGLHGLEPAMRLTGMVTDSLSRAESSPSLEYRRVNDRKTMIDLSDINCAAYGMPQELGRESFFENMFGPEAFAYVGYVNGQPLTTAGAWVVDGIVYVAVVATMPGNQRKGYAEAVMRHALQETLRATGLSRTVLHATDAGFPIYKRMGYRQVAEFMIYTSPHP